MWKIVSIRMKDGFEQDIPTIPLFKTYGDASRVVRLLNAAVIEQKLDIEYLWQEQEA